MQILVLGEQDVRELLPFAECIEVMSDALRALAGGDAVLPLRSLLMAPGDPGVLCVMPALVGHPRSIGLKAFTIFPPKVGIPTPSHPGAMLLFDGGTGAVLAVLEASAITEIRTAAVSAVATRALARPDAHRLAILGAGTQAAAHATSMRLARPVSEILIWDRTPARSARLAERLQASEMASISVRAVPSVELAVREADIICTTTSATLPILRSEWVRPGTHINAIGAAIPGRRELESALVARSRLYVDRRDSTEAEADEYRIPLLEGVFSPDHILGELGELLLGRVAGRTNPDEVTVFKSVGIAVEDVAAARHIFGKAIAQGRGTKVEFATEPAGTGPN
jgi:alanine dehydrogenase